MSGEMRHSVPLEVRKYNERKMRELFESLRQNPYQVFELRTTSPLRRPITVNWMETEWNV